MGPSSITSAELALAFSGLPEDDMAAAVAASAASGNPAMPGAPAPGFGAFGAVPTQQGFQQPLPILPGIGLDHLGRPPASGGPDSGPAKKRRRSHDATGPPATSQSQANVYASAAASAAAAAAAASAAASAAFGDPAAYHAAYSNELLASMAAANNGLLLPPPQMDPQAAQAMGVSAPLPPAPAGHSSDMSAVGVAPMMSGTPEMVSSAAMSMATSMPIGSAAPLTEPLLTTAVPMVSAPMAITSEGLLGAAPPGTPDAMAMAAAAAAAAAVAPLPGAPVVPQLGSKCAVADCVAPVRPLLSNAP